MPRVDDRQPDMDRLALQLCGLTKRYPGVVANDHIDLEVRKNEIHALVGENGAGKSTLMSILYGMFPPDEGSIRIDGAEVEFNSPLDAMDAGLGMVFQNFKLFPSLTVAENVVYRTEPRKGRFSLDRDTANEQVVSLAKRFDLDIDPTAKVEKLSVGEAQRVEIIKALYRGADTLILDEPTAVLTPQETDALLEVIRTLRDGGRTIVFITHKLREVMAVADRATVLRRGKVVVTRNIADTSPAELSDDMTGRHVDFGRRVRERAPGGVVLAVEHITSSGGQAKPRVADVSFAVHEGEIVGIAAIAGNGQEDLVHVLVGLTHADAGRISILGTPVHALTVEQRRKGFLAYIPDDRHLVGTAGTGSISQNLLMGYQRLTGFQRHGWLNRASVDEHSDSLVRRYAIKVANTGDRASSLSGGNLQKVVVARELAHDAPLLIADQPTRGVDIGAIEFIHQQLVEYRDRGGAILLLSADLNELLTLSTRIVVMNAGRVVAELNPLATSEA